MSKERIPDCFECKYFAEEYGEWFCDAFPAGIPETIASGRSHKKPYPGDHGIQFEAKK